MLELQKNFIPAEFFKNPMSFETDLVNVHLNIQKLKESLKDDVEVQIKINMLEEDLVKRITTLYDNLEPIYKVEIARHPNRPHGLDYINQIFSHTFFELCGDRLYGDDKAIITGLGKIENKLVMVIAHEKGHDTDSRRIHNFGMPLPEGYRKAIRVMNIAKELKIPVICLVDTPGAYPGVTSEERGQGCALAESIATLVKIEVPVFSCIIGEGGSGGAIALAVANKVLMLEHSVYSVISPEGCASILWRAKDQRAEAAVAQKLTAQDNFRYKLIDHIIPEPFGGAHRNPSIAIENVKREIINFLEEYNNVDLYHFYLKERQEKYRRITDPQ